MEIFHKKALDCRNPVTEDVLVHVCLYGIRIYLENLTFPSSSKSMDAMSHTNESVR